MKQVAVWGVVALLMVAAPLVFSSSGAIGELSLIAVMVVFALSYNVLLGQTGLLSFGHAVFYGVSGFAVVHAITAIGAAAVRIPLPVLPLLGGLTGLVLGLLIGSVATRRWGTAFAMITMGIGELVLSFAPILKTFFGGESGVSTNRMKVPAWLGLNFGSPLQAYYLIAAWCLASMIALYWVTQTPFGRLCNAVRENAERADFIGYDVHRIRSTSFAISSFFGGIAGGLAAINFEIMSVDSLGGLQSAWVLFMTYIGGSGTFYGPIIGAVLVSLMQFSLPGITPGWQLYSGLFFVVMVMFAPGGISGLLRMHEPLWRAGLLHRMAPAYLLASIPVLVMGIGVNLAVELSFARGARSGSSAPLLKFLGVTVSAASPTPWAAAVGLVIVGGFLLRLAVPRVGDAWESATQESRGKGRA